MRISTKLPVFAAILVLVVTVIFAAVSLRIASSSLEESAQQKIEAVTDGRRNQLETYLENLALDVGSIADNGQMLYAMEFLKSDWASQDEAAEEELRTRFKARAEAPDIEIGKPGTASVSLYEETHATYHGIIDTILEGRAYDDLMLVDTDGNVVYSIKKNADFGTNLLDGPWLDTAVAATFKEIVGQEKWQTVRLSKVEKYGPNDYQPTGYLARGIGDKFGLAGIMFIQLPMEKIEEILANPFGMGKTGEAVILDSANYLVTDLHRTPDDDRLSSTIGTDLTNLVEGRDVAIGQLDPGSGDQRDIAVARVDALGLSWYLATLVDHSETQAPATSVRNTIMLAGLLIILATIAVSTLYSRSLTKPIAPLVANMRALAEGDTTVDLGNEARRDEIGDMVRSVGVFRDAAISKLSLEREAEEIRSLTENERQQHEEQQASEARKVKKAVEALAGGLHRLAEGDLSVSIETSFDGELEVLRSDFNVSIEKLASAMAAVRTNVVAIKGASGEMSVAFEELSKRTEHQAASLEETSAALDQVTNTVKQSAERAAEANTMAAEAKTATDESGKVVSSAVDAMGRIETASREISQIINVIDEIAFQTNLLALNAGVEAARAGEAGKGFAVVAQEVRELAQRAASAAKDIKELINKSGSEVSNGVSLVKATGSVLEKIACQVSSINDHLNSISTASREQATGLQEINTAVNQMDQVTQQNADMVERTKCITQRLTNDAEQLDRLVARFQMDDFAVSHGSASPQAKFTPATATAASKPAVSPARQIVDSVSRAFIGGQALAQNASTENWEEF